MIKLYDANGNFLKPLYPRQAKGLYKSLNARYTSKDALQQFSSDTEAIYKAFPNTGATHKKSIVIERLTAYFKSQGAPDPYRSAIGALGGASRHEFISYTPSEDTWKRIR